MVEAVVPVAAESAGAVVVVAAASWLVVGLESQLASSKLVLRPVAKSARRWEMGMKEVEMKRYRMLGKAICTPADTLPGRLQKPLFYRLPERGNRGWIFITQSIVYVRLKKRLCHMRRQETRAQTMAKYFFK